MITLYNQLVYRGIKSKLGATNIIYINMQSINMPYLDGSRNFL